jgi:hypothetical protein
MKVTTIVYSYVCGVCNKQMKGTQNLLSCAECGRMLCKNHFENGLCSKCAQKVDYYIVEEIKKEIQKDNRHYFLKWLVLSIIFLGGTAVGFLDWVDISLYFYIIPIAGAITLPCTLPTMLLFRRQLRFARKSKFTRKVYQKYGKMDAWDMFSVSKPGVYSTVATNVHINRARLAQVHERFKTLVEWYGMEEVLQIIMSFLKIQGVNSPQMMEQALGELAQDYQTN